MTAFTENVYCYEEGKKMVVVFSPKQNSVQGRTICYDFISF